MFIQVHKLVLKVEKALVPGTFKLFLVKCVHLSKEIFAQSLRNIVSVKQSSSFLHRAAALHICSFHYFHHTYPDVSLLS